MIFLVLLLMFDMPVALAHHPQIVLGINHAPPYTFVDTNQQGSGIILDIMQRIEVDVGFELEVVSCPFPRCLKMAKEGKIDMLGGLIKNPQRNDLFRLYRTSLHGIKFVLCILCFER